MTENLTFLNQYFLTFAKYFIILGLVIYLIFAIVVARQVTTMSKQVNDKFNTFLIAFSYLHLLFSILIVLFAWIIL